MKHETNVAQVINLFVPALLLSAFLALSLQFVQLSGNLQIKSDNSSQRSAFPARNRSSRRDYAPGKQFGLKPYPWSCIYQIPVLSECAAPSAWIQQSRSTNEALRHARTTTSFLCDLRVETRLFRKSTVLSSILQSMLQNGAKEE